MNESDFKNKITIIGIGQIGGSLALSFKRFLKDIEITAWDCNTELLRNAKGIIDRQANSLEKAVINADMVWLATPVNVILDLIPRIVSINKNALFCDVGSSKSKIVNSINALRKQCRFISTHPFAGTEKTGMSAWDEHLFLDKPFFIIPTKKSSRTDIAFIQTLIKKIHAIPHFIDATTHDKILACTSHLPFAISLALQCMLDDLNLSDKLIYEGPAFKSMTRIAKCPFSTMKPILATNKKYIDPALKIFLKHLANILRG